MDDTLSWFTSKISLVVENLFMVIEERNLKESRKAKLTYIRSGKMRGAGRRSRKANGASEKFRGL